MKFARIAAIVLAAFAASPASASELKWSDWNDELFSRATVEKRFVILDLDTPFDGFFQVSSAPMRDALAHLSR